MTETGPTDLSRWELQPPMAAALDAVGAFVVGDVDPMARDSAILVVVHGACGTRSHETTYLSGVEWTVQHWEAGRVEELLALVEDPLTSLLPRDAWESLVALAEGRPVAGVEWLTEVQRRLGRSRLCELRSIDLFARADLLVETATGLLTSEQAPAAAIAARECFEHVVDGILAAHGHLRCDTPSRLAMLRSAASPAVPISPETFWKVELMEGLSQATAAAWTLDVLRTCMLTLAAFGGSGDHATRHLLEMTGSA